MPIKFDFAPKGHICLQNVLKFRKKYFPKDHMTYNDNISYTFISGSNYNSHFQEQAFTYSKTYFIFFPPDILSPCSSTVSETDTS